MRRGKKSSFVLLIGEEGKLVEPPPEYRYLLHRRPEEGEEEEEEGEGEERKEPMHTAEQRVRPRYSVVKNILKYPAKVDFRTLLHDSQYLKPPMRTFLLYFMFFPHT
jgi:hypothetical protein